MRKNNVGGFIVPIIGAIFFVLFWFFLIWLSGFLSVHILGTDVSNLPLIHLISGVLHLFLAGTVMAFVFNGLSYKNKNFTKEDLLITVLFIRKKPDQFFINKNIYSIYAFLIGWGLGADMNNIAVEFVTYIAQKKRNRLCSTIR